MEVLPLKTIDEVMSWRYTDESNRNIVPLLKTCKKFNGTPSLLVCHDMKGGYLEDRFVEGSTDICYRFYHWQDVDLFVYFSHHFITIPPPAWINSGHRNGVKVMGTFITEWEDGCAICVDFLRSSTVFRALADKMVDIMKYYQFDGWLVNIENVIQVENVSKLKDFVAYLCQRCHTEQAGSKVVWYDSVINTGELKWQNELNDKNKLFFDVCDGIFLNYCWNEKKLEDSFSMVTSNGRATDVFVGVDVFGRGCPGGGGFNTIEALYKIKAANLSVALFAPGWVYETLGTDFNTNQDKFWRCLQDACHIRIFTSLQLSTYFCRGYGRSYFCKGQMVSSMPWYHLSRQCLQPAYRIDGESLTVVYVEDDGFVGGGCLELRKLPSHTPSWFQLFRLSADVETHIYLSIAVKVVKPGEDNPVLRLTFSKRKLKQSLHLSTTSPLPDNESIESCPKQMQLDEEACLYADRVECNGNQWNTCYFCIEADKVNGWTLDSISAGFTHKGCSEASYKLGYLQVSTLKPILCNFVQEVTCSLQLGSSGDMEVNQLDLRVAWQDQAGERVLYYNIYHEPTSHAACIVQHSIITSCTVSLPRSSFTGRLIVQAVTDNGGIVPLSECSSCLVPRI